MGKRHHKKIEPPHFFYVNGGKVIKNLKEFAFMIEKLSEEEYRHHVTPQRNDFSSWIRDVIGDAKLAMEISNANDKRDVQIAVLKRLVR